MKWAALPLLALLSYAAPAGAFCQATTCDPSVSDCGSDAQGCSTRGRPLFWASSCVTVSVQGNGAPTQGIDFAAAEASVQRAFQTWTSVACGRGRPSISVRVEGPITCATSEYNSKRGNANIVRFREDEWPYAGGADALGLTILNFDPNTGEIWDADIELNAVDEPLSVGEPSSNQVDLESLITHESGHLLGLAHTKDPNATMFAGYQRGSIGLRSLEADDIAGVCALYPATRVASTSSCEPRHGFSDLCAAEQPEPMTPDGSDDVQTKGCAFAPSGRPSFAAVIGLSVLAVWLRRKRR
jgi:hypothetical protein